jgi:hypothetical protein
MVRNTLCCNVCTESYLPYHFTSNTSSTSVWKRCQILNTVLEANWKLIQDRKQKLINKNNERENAQRIAHEYKAEDKVLCVSKPTLAKFGTDPWEGPYDIVKVNDNGTVNLRKGAVIETINI